MPESTVDGAPDHNQESMWAQAPPKPMAPQNIPAELFNNNVLTKPQIEELPEFMHVQGMPEAEGQPEGGEPDAEGTPELDEPLPTPPNPQSANQHIFTYRPQRPEHAQEGKVEASFQPLPFIEQAIKPASSPVAASLYDMVEFYSGVSYDKQAIHSFTCHYDFFYFAPHPLSCSKYIICSSKVAYEHECGEGVYWDYLGLKCSLPKNSACFKDTHEIEYETDHIDIASNELPPDYFGHPEILDPGFAAPMPDWEGESMNWDDLPKPEVKPPKKHKGKHPHAPHAEHVEEAIPDLDFTSVENQGWGDWTPPGLEEEAGLFGEYSMMGSEMEPQEYDTIPGGSLGYGGFGGYVGYSDNGKNNAASSHVGGVNKVPEVNTNQNQGYGNQGQGYANQGYASQGQGNQYQQGGHWGGNAGFMSVNEVVDEHVQDSSEEQVVPAAESVELEPKVTVVEDDFPECPESDQTFYPYQKDCRKYFICISGLPILTSCPEHMAWDAEQSQCREEAKASCFH